MFLTRRSYLGTWRSENGRVKIKIKKLSQKSVTFTYWQTNKKKTASCKAKVKKSVAGNATRFSFTDSLGNVAKGYLTFDNGRLYVNIKTKQKRRVQSPSFCGYCYDKRIKDTKNIKRIQ